MAVTVKNLKHFMMSQKAMQLALGFFVLKALFDVVKAVNDEIFKKVAGYFSSKLTEKINVGSFTFGVGIDSEAIVDRLLEFGVAMTFAFLVSRMAKLNISKIPFFMPIGFSA